jgi:predicted house-cleaning noncanonical NTP pyrophosphatase (MazG superfamily)
MKYDKLVRDKIPEILKEKKLNPVTHIADDKEYIIKLKEKLLEEVNEFLKEDNIEEIADIYEVLDAIIENKNINKQDIEKIQEKKLDERGGFKNKIILDESED